MSRATHLAIVLCSLHLLDRDHQRVLQSIADIAARQAFGLHAELDVIHLSQLKAHLLGAELDKLPSGPLVGKGDVDFSLETSANSRVESPGQIRGTQLLFGVSKIHAAEPGGQELTNNTPSLSLPTPSIWTNNSVFSPTRRELASGASREPHKESISSMKMIDGFFSRAS